MQFRRSFAKHGTARSVLGTTEARLCEIDNRHCLKFERHAETWEFTVSRDASQSSPSSYSWCRVWAVGLRLPTILPQRLLPPRARRTQAPPAPAAAPAGPTTAELKVMADTLWVLITGMLVFFMNLGFACVESGMCRAKNCVNILSKNFVVFAD